jgi:hypothetical protein
LEPPRIESSRRSRPEGPLRDSPPPFSITPPPPWHTIPISNFGGKARRVFHAMRTRFYAHVYRGKAGGTIMAEVTRATREARLREQFTYEELLEYFLDMEEDMGVFVE